MRAKTILIIILTILVTVVLMKNTDEVIFWLFGDRYIPKLAILGTMFAIGFVVGFLVGRPRRKAKITEDTATDTTATDPNDEFTNPYRSNLSDEDRKYID